MLRVVPVALDLGAQPRREQGRPVQQVIDNQRGRPRDQADLFQVQGHLREAYYPAWRHQARLSGFARRRCAAWKSLIFLKSPEGAVYQSTAAFHDHQGAPPRPVVAPTQAGADAKGAGRLHQESLVTKGRR